MSVEERPHRCTGCDYGKKSLEYIMQRCPFYFMEGDAPLCWQDERMMRQTSTEVLGIQLGARYDRVKNPETGIIDLGFSHRHAGQD